MGFPASALWIVLCLKLMVGTFIRNHIAERIASRSVCLMVLLRATTVGPCATCRVDGVKDGEAKVHLLTFAFVNSE